MPLPRLSLLVVLAATLYVAAQAPAKLRGQSLEADIDPAIAKVLAATPAFDNHAHTVLPPPNDTADRDFDALPVDSMEPETDPVALRPDNPQLAAAWQALFGVQLTPPLDPAATQRLNQARKALKQREGQNYDRLILQKSGIGTEVANRVSMGPGLPTFGPMAGPDSARKPNFRWVPYADALLFPLDNTALAAANPDRGSFFPLEDKLRARYLHDLGLSAPPQTLDEYLRTVVTPTLERQHAAGAIAEKFEVAYLRPFGFDDVAQAEAARIYAAGTSTTTTTSNVTTTTTAAGTALGTGRTATRAAAGLAEYDALQDFLFRYIAAECGRLGMAVHLHTISGAGSYFSIAGANPMRLEPLFNDPRLRKTRFVLLHGGWPFIREATALLQKPNVYLDLSQESLLFPPRTLAAFLRERLETFPGKVLFATDGYPYSEALGWEESTWIASRNIRTALALALTGMLRDHEIDQPQAEKLARMVLRENALALYTK